MSVTTSPSTGKKYGLKRVCEVWRIPRSTVYSQRSRGDREKQKRGPRPRHSDDMIVKKIKEDLASTIFTGEGHSKVHSRIRKQGTVVGRQRVLRLMKENNLLSPHRVDSSNKAKNHDGKIITDAPGIMWGADFTKVYTAEDGWVNFFGLIEHWNAECMGWVVVKKADRFAAIEALRKGVQKGYGNLDPGVARGLQIRPDHGSQFTSEAYRSQSKYWGISLSYSLVKEPETNGVVERFHRTFKEQIVHGHMYRNIDEFHNAVKRFVEAYNEKWLLQKLGYQSPLEARRAWNQSKEMKAA